MLEAPGFYLLSAAFAIAAIIAGVLLWLYSRTDDDDPSS